MDVARTQKISTPGPGRSMSIVHALTVIAVVLLFYRDAINSLLDGLDYMEMDVALTGMRDWFPKDNPLYWRPVWHSIFNLMLTSFGLNPPAFHIFILFMYICLLFLLYHFYNLFIEDRTHCWITTLLFATFWLHAEIVTRLVFSADLFWTLLGLGAITSFYHYRETSRLGYYFLAITLAILCSGIKEPAVILPLLLLAVDCYRDPKVLSCLFSLRWKDLLAHIPFFSIAAVTLAILLYRSTFTFYYGFLRVEGVTLFQVIERVGFLTAYSLSPCFLSTKLTPLFAFIILVLLGYVFWYSPGPKRRFLLFISTCMVITFLPYFPIGITPRHATFGTVFSLLLVTLVIFEVGGWMQALLGNRTIGGNALGPVLTSIVFLLPCTYVNYGYIHQYNATYKYAGRILNGIIEDTARTFPKELDGSKIIHVNLPWRISGTLPWTTMMVAFSSFYEHALPIYLREHGTPLWGLDDISGLDVVDEVYVDLPHLPKEGIIKYELSHTIDNHHDISPEEFDSLAADPKNKLLFFSPTTERLVDVSGWNYQQLVKSVIQF